MPTFASGSGVNPGILSRNISDKSKKKEIDKNFPTVKDFFAINSTDAQEFTTAKEHIDVLFSQGTITLEQHEMASEKLQDQITNGVTNDNMLTEQELKFVFQPQKPVYAGTIFDKKSGKIHYNL